MFEHITFVCKGVPSMLADQERPLNYISRLPRGWSAQRRVNAVARMYVTLDPSAILRAVLMYQPFGKLFVIRTIPEWWKEFGGFERV